MGDNLDPVMDPQVGHNHLEVGVVQMIPLEDPSKSVNQPYMVSHRHGGFTGR